MSVLFPSLYKAPLFLSLQIHTFPYFSLKACFYHCGYISGSKHKTLSHMNKGNLQLSKTTIITTCLFLLPMHQRLQMFPVTCYILSLPFWDPFLQSICTYPSDLNLEGCFSMCFSPVFMTLPPDSVAAAWITGERTEEQNIFCQTKVQNYFLQ